MLQLVRIRREAMLIDPIPVVGSMDTGGTIMRYWYFVLPVALAACATTGPGNTGIAVETASNGQALAGANCVVTNNNGSWNVVTPATIDVGPANGDLRVVCNKAGYRTSEFVYRPSTYNSSGSSVGLGLGGGSGGRVGVGLGLSVPIGGSSGGTYPGRIGVDMTPQ